MNLGEYLIRLLERYGVEVMFGIPGVHTAEMYRGLAASPIRHIAPRHEQGAGFMADGYARTTGKPGVCLLITGPGLSNAATAMLQAKADSIPMLVITGVNARGDMGSGRGHLHEMPDQRGFAGQCAVFSRTVETPDVLPEAIARAFAVFEGARPGPVHIEIPLDLMGASAEGLPLERAPQIAPPLPADLDEADAAVRAAQRPVILLGGGGMRGAAEAVALAERLDAPLVTTMNARAAAPHDHPLNVGASPGHPAVQALVEEADLVLAFGTEMGPTDYSDYDTGAEARPKRLLRVDIDPEQIARGPRCDIALVGDARATMQALNRRLGDARAERGGAGRARSVRAAVWDSLSPDYRRYIELLNGIRDAAPAASLVGDSTQLIYAGNLAFAAGNQGDWFNSSAGFGTLGYAIPAALGAKIGAPHRPAVAIIGDGGAQFTLGELGTIADSGLPVVVIVWNNKGYGEIRTYMQDRQIKPEGVDLTPPDFTMVAQAYGLDAVLLDDAGGLPQAVADAIQADRATVIEVRG